MSTSGTYAYWPKVMHPEKVYPQMESDTYQPAFFFGGSQIPVNLGIVEGSGFGSKYKSHIDEMKSQSAQGRGLKTTVKKGSKIYLPKHMSTIRKVI